MMDRRKLLSRITLVLSGGIAVLVGAPVIGFLLAPLFAPEPDTFVAVADLKNLTIGATTLVKFSDPSPLPWAGQTADAALWVRRIADAGEGAFQVFSVNCTHLGCPVDWRAGAKLFLCPCHGGVYYADGTVAGGPPPRPLVERAWKVEGEKLLVKTQRLPTAGTKAG